MSQKYAQLEIERRWLVPGRPEELVRGAPFTEIEDRYVTGTRLRLRVVRVDGSANQWKFCKKYGRSPDKRFEYITNLYLSEPEFCVLAALPSSRSVKRRYRLARGSLDLYTRPSGIAIFEAEFSSEAEADAFMPPEFVGEEVTGEEAYSGAEIARLG